MNYVNEKRLKGDASFGFDIIDKANPGHKSHFELNIRGFFMNAGKRDIVKMANFIAKHNDTNELNRLLEALRFARDKLDKDVSKIAMHKSEILNIMRDYMDIDGRLSDLYVEKKMAELPGKFDIMAGAVNSIIEKRKAKSDGQR